MCQLDYLRMSVFYKDSVNSILLFFKEATVRTQKFLKNQFISNKIIRFPLEMLHSKGASICCILDKLLIHLLIFRALSSRIILLTNTFCERVLMNILINQRGSYDASEAADAVVSDGTIDRIRMGGEQTCFSFSLCHRPKYGPPRWAKQAKRSPKPGLGHPRPHTARGQGAERIS